MGRGIIRVTAENFKEILDTGMRDWYVRMPTESRIPFAEMKLVSIDFDLVRDMVNILLEHHDLYSWCPGMQPYQLDLEKPVRGNDLVGRAEQ